MHRTKQTPGKSMQLQLAVNMLVEIPCSTQCVDWQRTFVMAAVSVVLPWSTCPMVPMFKCGFDRALGSYPAFLACCCDVRKLQSKACCVAVAAICTLWQALRYDQTCTKRRHTLHTKARSSYQRVVRSACEHTLLGLVLERPL